MNVYRLVLAVAIFALSPANDIVQWAAQTGPCCARVVEEILASRPHTEQGFRSCLGIIRLGKGAGLARLEAACRRASITKFVGMRTKISAQKVTRNLRPPWGSQLAPGCLQRD